MKQTITLYIHQIPGEPQRAFTCDLSDFPSAFGAQLGVQDVEVEFDEIDRDPTAALIDALVEEIEREVKASSGRVNELREKIARLACIEFKPDEDNGEGLL